MNLHVEKIGIQLFSERCSRNLATSGFESGSSGLPCIFWCGVEALQNYLWKHPALLDVTDKKLLKFTESCLERVDMLEFKVISWDPPWQLADKTWDDFGRKLWMVDGDSKFKNTYHISYDKMFFSTKTYPYQHSRHSILHDSP